MLSPPRSYSPLPASAGPLQGTDTTASAKAGRLVAFGSCGELLGYARSQAGRSSGRTGSAAGLVLPRAPPRRGAGAGLPRRRRTRDAAPQEGVDYSGTNVQEQGVDEPDIVKTNGKTLFARRERLRRRGRRPRRTSRAARLAEARQRLDPRAAPPRQPPARALARRVLGRAAARDGRARHDRVAPSQSTLTEVDVSDPRAMRVMRTLTLDGAYVAARMVGGDVRVVVSSRSPDARRSCSRSASTSEALAAAKAKTPPWSPRRRARAGSRPTR